MQTIPIAKNNTSRSAALHILFSKHDKTVTNALSSTDLASLYIDMTMTRSSTTGGKTKPPTQQDINAIMRFIDSDGSDALDRGEFLEWLESGMTKTTSDLKKFASQGSTQSLLVDFLQGVIAHAHAWIGSFETIFKNGEDGLTDAKLWSKLKKGMNNASMFTQQGAGSGGSGGSGGNGGSGNSGGSGQPPPLKSILLMSPTAGSSESLGLIRRQETLDFLVHMALHSSYRPHTVTQQQKQIYRFLLSTVEAGIQETKSSVKTVISNPLVILACSAMFSTYDTSGDDVLDGAELRRMLVSVCENQNGGAPGRGETEELMQLLDTSGDGMISRDEFITAVLNIMSEGGGESSTVKLATKLELGVVNLARQLERRRTMLHRLHKKYSYNNQLNRDGLSRLLRHCQRKQKIEQSEGSGSNDNQTFAKVTDAAVDSLMNCYQVATSKTGGGGEGGDGEYEFVMSSAGFSGPILLSSCMHPAQIQEQRIQSRAMSVVLDMYELMNAEVGRMVQDADMKRDRKRNAVRVPKGTATAGGATAGGAGVSSSGTGANIVEENSDTSSDDDEEGGGGGGRYDDGGGGGGGGSSNSKVDFGW